MKWICFAFLFVVYSNAAMSVERCYPVNDFQGNYTVSCPNYSYDPTFNDEPVQKKKSRPKHIFIHQH